MSAAHASPPRWDVIIVGARVAGATLAGFLGQAGLRTLLVDRMQFPAYYPRQASWGLETEERWATLGVLPRINALGAPARRGYFTATEDAVLTYRFPEGEPSVYNKMARRLVLDPLLAENAASFPSVELRLGVTASSLCWDQDRVAGLRLARDGGEYQEPARLVVGADGRHSWLARQVKAARHEYVPAPKANFIADYAGTNVQPDMSVRVWDQVGSMGMAMMEDSLVTVGVGVPLTEIQEFRAGLPDTFERRLRHHPLYDSQIGSGKRVSPVGGAVDLGMYKRKPYGPGWALVGDAGYHLDPLAARGTTAAVAGAQLLADAIVSYLAGDSPEPAAFERYQAERDRVLASEWDVSLAAMTRGTPTERDVQEARLLASRPDLVERHILVLRGLADADEFRATLEAELGPRSATV
ncbi:MAG: NAD(P)/FAD-dependent oxidoreductase [Chloroflexota bacterium]